MMQETGNRGEWSEVYVLFKLLSEGRLYAADGDLNKKTDLFYEIVNIIRKEDIGVLTFVYGKDEVKIYKDEEFTKIEIITNNFKEEAEYLFEKILESSESAFKVERTNNFMREILCNKLKAPSSNKEDITITIHDSTTNIVARQGFSIKSRVGKPSTLLNAGAQTNFVFKILGEFNDSDMEAINNIYVIRRGKKEVSVAGRIQYLKDHDFFLDYYDMVGTMFKNNLTLIDSLLPKIVGELLLENYVNGTSSVYDAVENIARKNPLGYDVCEDHPYYKYKVKRMLTESALGMVPGTTWDGQAAATGGYIVVKEDGDVLCYHLYNRNDFEEYLLNNVRFEHASTKRYSYASVEKVNGEYYIKLNLQIRFLR